MTENEFVALAVDWIRGNSPKAEGGVEITPRTDLLKTGLLDSIAFANLIVHIQEETGLEIDLVEIDPEDFTRLGGLYKQAMEGE